MDYFSERRRRLYRRPTARFVNEMRPAQPGSRPETVFVPSERGRQQAQEFMKELEGREQPKTFQPSQEALRRRSEYMQKLEEKKVGKPAKRFGEESTELWENESRYPAAKKEGYRFEAARPQEPEEQYDPGERYPSYEEVRERTLKHSSMLLNEAARVLKEEDLTDHEIIRIAKELRFVAEDLHGTIEEKAAK